MNYMDPFFHARSLQERMELHEDLFQDVMYDGFIYKKTKGVSQERKTSMAKQKWTKAGKSKGRYGGIVVRNEKGKEQTLLSPSQKGAKYADELREYRHLTNEGKLKYPGTDKEWLTKSQRAFRAGYLQAQRDSANAYKSKHPRLYPKKK